MPTVTIGDNTGDSFSGTTDCEINSFEPTTNKNGTEFEIKNDATFPSAALIRFPGLSNITGPVTVTSARLRLWLIQEGSFAVVPIVLRRMLRDWVETQATWNIYSTGNNWTTAGALGDATDRVAAASSSGNVGDGTGAYYDITGLAADVQGWINGDFSNFGWRVEVGTNGEWKKFVARSGTDGQRPILEVVYTTGGAGGGAMYVVSIGL